ncbi:hypothetical protein HY491_01060 [Candidatus Woesearchaeota archaeon]|nr:hypothetical protein [Candidatus Woesearchaeota archaeon]
MAKKIVVFDVGGVLLEFDFQRMYDAWAAEVGSSPGMLRSWCKKVAGSGMVGPA